MGREYLRKALRGGHLYRELLAEVQGTEWLGADELAEFQRRKLAELFQWGREQVPYFREVLAGLDVRDPFEVLQVLPYLDKAAVRAQGASLQARTHRLSVAGGTSGSTGTPLRLRHDFASVLREQAFNERQRRWAGYRTGERRAWWRGDLVVPTSQSEPPFWRFNRAQNMLMLSSYHLSEQNMHVYQTALERFDPVIIQAYPSSIGFLAKYLEIKGQYYRGANLKGIITSSETLTEEQCRSIEARMGCRVFDLYGGYERVAAIGTCERGNRHLLTDYSYVELRPIEAGTHEIVGTSFHERAMPLLRYRTSDEVEMAEDDTTCSCGRAFPVVRRIIGRMDDYIKTPDGRSISRLGFIFKNVGNVAEAQIRQLKLDEVEIAVVPLEGFGPATKEQILANARDRLGPELNISVVTESNLPRTANGKVRTVVSTV